MEMEDEEVVDVAEEYMKQLSGTGWNHGRSGRWYE